MGGTDGHVSRTLLVSRKAPGMLLVSRGSQSNLDYATLNVSTGVSTIKAFNVTNITESSYSFAEDGLLLGWGLRNSVGVGEEPVTGAIYSVENSVDDFNRSGENIHQNNPGEEMNFHGYLNGTETTEQGGNYGYPTCFAAWAVDEIPDNEGVQVGTQVAIGEQNSTLNDTFCREDRVPPRLTFQAHQAPLDIKFNPNGTAAWVTFHGSWYVYFERLLLTDRCSQSIGTAINPWAISSLTSPLTAPALPWKIRPATPLPSTSSPTRICPSVQMTAFDR